ncbi:MAG: hypothetical protein LBI68_02510, partial [Azoarcus sp.]|nr:hypothetical protein [Azoarcus sp.]
MSVTVLLDGTKEAPPQPANNASVTRARSQVAKSPSRQVAKSPSRQVAKSPSRQVAKSPSRQ